MIRLISTLLMMLTVGVTCLQAQTYDQLWKQVERAEGDDLPRQVLAVGDKILAKARKEKNFAQMMRAWVTIVETKISIDTDSFDVAQFPDIKPSSPAEHAIYNAVMASAYSSMNDADAIRYDAESQKNYEESERKHIQLALSDMDMLGTTHVDPYETLIERGDDSRMYDHDLLSLLTHFVIERCDVLSCEEVIDLYGKVMEYYMSKNRREAYTLFCLDYLGYRTAFGTGNMRLPAQAFTDSLQVLLSQSEDIEAGADVARALIHNINDSDEQLRLSRWAQTQFKGSTLLPYFSNVEQSIMRKSCYVQTVVKNDFVVGDPIGIKVQFNNLTSVVLELRKFIGRDAHNELKTDGRLLQTKTYPLGTDSLNTARRAQRLPTSGTVTDSLTLDAGKYVLVARSEGESHAIEIDVTSLRLFHYRMPGGKLALAVLNNKTGRPVAGANVSYTVSSADGEKTTVVPTDDETPLVYGSNPLRQSARDLSTREHTQIFTDRAIYRPGQPLHVAGISYRQNGDETMAAVGMQILVSLFDANNDKIDEAETTADEWGTWSVDFNLPSGRLPGTYSIRTRSASATIRVEEYRRPTFTVETRQASNEQPERQYTFGDSLDVEAVVQSYSGVPQQGAKVIYKVECAEVLWRTWFGARWEELADGETTTDDNGVARVSLFLTDSLLHRVDGIMRYRVTFDVTSAAGETHSEVFTTAISRRGFGLRVDMSPTIDMSKPAEFVVNALNAQNRAVEVQGNYYIVKSRRNPNDYVADSDDEMPSDSSLLRLPKELIVGKGVFESGQPLPLTALEAGYYVLYAVSTDAKGNEIISSANFAAFNSSKATPLDGKRKGEPTHFSDTFSHFENDEYTFAEGRPARLFFSPCADDIYLTYMLMSDSAVVERHSVVLDRELRQLTIGYRPEYGDGVTLLMYYVKDGIPYTESHTILRAEPDKRLLLSWHTFRDRLRPGQQEEWILTITDPKGNKVNGAQLMATLYDASLDALTRHSWQMHINYSYHVNFFNIYASRNAMPQTIILRMALKTSQVKERQWDRLTAYIDASLRPRFLSAPLMMKSNMMVSRSMADIEDDASAGVTLRLQGRVAGLNVVEEMTSATADGDDDSETLQHDNSTPTLRTNFDETAFFMPRVRTDEEGRAHLSFTLPESLTEWRLLGLAHTPSMDYGTIEATAVARKDFMIQPNMPRFVRDGDRATITSLLINRTDAVQDTRVCIRLLDAESLTEVFADCKSVSVQPNQTLPVTFGFTATAQYPMLVTEITAESATFSDGERQYLPVLSSKQYVTETVPFYIKAGESIKNVDLHTLFNNGSNTASHRRLVLEYTHNPAWTIIEALNAVKVPERNDAVTLAAALYSSVAARQLAQQIPELQQVLEHQATMPKSDLDANDDLRDIVQTESPWLRNARDEARQRAELIDFFNPALMATRIDNARNRLLQLQNSDGSWSWFEGMPGNYYTTLGVCHMLAMMRMQPNVTEPLQRAMAYLDTEQLRRYEETRRLKQAASLDESTLHYLFVSSLMPDRKVGRDVVGMRATYLKLIAKSSRQLSIYGKANGANILRAFGMTRQADKLTESAVEYTVSRPDMGRYYATDRAHYSWLDYKLPTHIAAMRAIQSSNRTDRNQLLADMLMWLIRQKQVQTWDNPLNTIDAVSLLLAHDGHMLATGGTPSFWIDDKMIDTSVDTTLFMSKQLGYVKTTIPEADYGASVDSLRISAAVDDAMQPVSHQEAASSLSYGAVYAQFLEPMERLQTNSSGELKISRKVYKDGKEVDPSTCVFSVGDKITIRIIVTADRDVDFIQVRSPHAACLEPQTQLSGYRWMNGRGGYVSMHDASADIFFDRFTRGTTTCDITYHVTRSGTYLAAVATVQCAYAPEFSAHTDAIRIVVE